MQTSWPARLWLVRHGESAGNVARDAAERDRLERIALDSRDVDVPLSDLGKRQAEALGTWLAQQAEDERPTAMWTSPYVRAQQTAELALSASGLEVPLFVDERLREREFGVLDGLTRRGIEAQWPQESERRAAIGKFYHRPPGGESWTDALLRVRSALSDIRMQCEGERVMIVGHQVVVLLCRYVAEGMSEAEILAIDKLGDVANCSLTEYVHDEDAGEMRLVRYNDVQHLEEQDEPVTDEPDTPMARAESLTPQLLRGWPLPRTEEGDDKHDRGTVLVVGGAVSTPGAVLLAGLAALRAGAGRLQVATVPETAVSLAVALPEAMVLGLEDLGSVDLDDADAVLVGPGLIDAEGALKGVRARIEDTPLVVDARALRCLDGPVPGGVLTPNAGELEHLGGKGEVRDMALAVAQEREAVVATHGWVAAPDGRLWRLEVGGVGLGTSGSGDVLAGIVVGLLARGADPAQAACWGSYLHAAAGDRLAAVHGRVGYLARELLDEVPALMSSLA